MGEVFSNTAIKDEKPLMSVRVSSGASVFVDVDDLDLGILDFEGTVSNEHETESFSVQVPIQVSNLL